MATMSKSGHPSVVGEMEFYYPETIDEAVRLLEKPSAVAVAGGTSFVARRPEAECLVDLTRLGLNYIKDDGSEVHIGATTTITELQESPIPRGLASGILSAACSTLADTKLRNVITVGGNIACGHPWAHLPPVLMVLEARLEIAGRQKRVIPIERFFDSKLLPGEFISEVIIPKGSNTGKGAFVKFSRTESDYSRVTVAAYAERQGDEVSTIRVAVSGVTAPTRVKVIEEWLRGKKVDEGFLAEIAAKAAAQLPVAKGYIFSEEYLREVLGILLKRALAEVLMEGWSGNNL